MINDIEVGRYALRTFHVDNGSLLSVSAPLTNTWRDGTCEAKCMAGRLHKAPRDGCSCGIYGTLEVPPLMWQYFAYARQLITVFAAEGKTIIGDTGLRTQYARVVAYWVAEDLPSSLPSHPLWPHLRLSRRELKKICEAQLGGAKYFADLGEMLTAYGFPPGQILPQCKIVMPVPSPPFDARYRGARWWRQRIHRDMNGNLITTTVDDPDKPTEITYTWCDLLGTVAQTVTPYAVRITNNRRYEDVYAWSGDLIGTTLLDFECYHLDVLWHEQPTSGRWLDLTPPGVDMHPDDQVHKNNLAKPALWRIS